MSKEIFTTCPNCQNRMRLEFFRHIDDGKQYFERENIAEEYKGECSLCSLKMEICKPIK